MNSNSQLVKISDVTTVLSKHDYKGAVIAEKGGGPGEAGIMPVEVTPEGDSNA